MKTNIHYIYILKCKNITYIYIYLRTDHTSHTLPRCSWGIPKFAASIEGSSCRDTPCCARGAGDQWGSYLQAIGPSYQPTQEREIPCKWWHPWTMARYRFWDERSCWPYLLNANMIRTVWTKHTSLLPDKCCMICGDKLWFHSFPGLQPWKEAFLRKVTIRMEQAKGTDLDVHFVFATETAMSEPPLNMSKFLG